MKKKKIITLLLLLVVVVSGCSDSSDTSSGGDDVLTIWGYYEGAPKEALLDYEEATGNEVEYVTIGFDDMQTKLNTVLGTSDAPDIVHLDRTWLGQYLPSEDFLAYEDVMEDTTQLDSYKENAYPVAIDPGVYNEQVKAYNVGGSPSSVYFYRSDIAEKCLDVTSPEEMEALTPTFESYADLQEIMNESDDESCHDVSITGYPSYEVGLISLAGMFNLEEDGSYVIPKEFDDVLDTIKTINEGSLVYSPQYDKTQVVAGNEEDKILGEISPSYLKSSIEQYDQAGLWSIAQTPLNYTAGGTFFGITSNADTDMVSEYMDITFLNEEWSIENMASRGNDPNSAVIETYLEEEDAIDPYFNQVVIEEFDEASEKVTIFSDVTPYDVGIKKSIENTVKAYALDGTIENVDDAKEQLKTDINALYPDLEITIE